MKVGDKVTWMTKGRGSVHRRVVGEVVMVVPPGTLPPTAFSMDGRDITSRGFKPITEATRRRVGESYLVAVPTHNGYRLYWPFVKTLAVAV